MLNTQGCNTDTKMIRCLSIFVGLFNILVCFSQTQPDIPVVEKNDLPEAKVSSSRVFNGSSLFGYIDGGAELYLEYGFEAASVMKIEYKGGEFKTEIYKMTGPEEAFGIFSVSKYRCLSMPALSEFSCQTKYQLQICKGPFYISIINGTGTPSDSIASLEIGKIIADKIKDKEVELSSYLPDINIETLQTRTFLAKGRLGVVNGSPELEDLFLGATDYTAVIAREDTIRVISVKFRNKEAYQNFIELHDWEKDKLVLSGNVKKIGEYHLLIEMPD
jgi:hypothetical protein